MTSRFVLSFALSALLPLAAFAQEQKDKSDEAVQEIIVTAQKRETSLQDVPFSVAACQPRSRSANPAPPTSSISRAISPGLSIADLGPGQSQVAIRGISAGQVDARPARREGAGRHLSRRVADLGGAVHAGPRPLRPRSLRSAARPAGHAVRRRLDLGHAALHHRAARARQVRRLGRSSASHGVADGEYRRRRQRRDQCCRSAKRPRLRVVGYYNRARRDSSMPCSPDAQRAERRERRQTHRRRASRCCFSPTENLSDHAAHRLPEARDRRLSAHRRLQHPRQSDTTTEPQDELR